MAFLRTQSKWPLSLSLIRMGETGKRKLRAMRIANSNPRHKKTGAC